MTAVTWTDEQLAATIWVSFTFGPLIVIELYRRSKSWMSHTAAVAAALVSLAEEVTHPDLPETDTGDYADLRDDSADSVTDGDHRTDTRSARDRKH